MDAGGDHTFLFADIVGYTAFTERVGDEVAADVAVGFQAVAVRLAADHRCDVVKQLGDAVMIHGRDAGRVVALGLAITRELADAGWCPPVRMGVHSGTAVRRGGDWYGATVNVAARLADSAAPGEVLMSATTRRCVEHGTGVALDDRGARSFKNVTVPLAVFAAAA